MANTAPALKWACRWAAAGLIGAGLVACGSPRTTPDNAAIANVAGPSNDNIVAAWTYLYGRYLVLQQENYDINVEKVGYNRIKYNPLGSAQFVNPNLDVAYLEAWLAADKDHAVILNVPKIKGRYYTVELLDGWGEVITNINERTYPDHPYGKFALVIAAQRVGRAQEADGFVRRAADGPIRSVDQVTEDGVGHAAALRAVEPPPALSHRRVLAQERRKVGEFDLAQRVEVAVDDEFSDRLALGHEAKLVRDAAGGAGVA